MIASPITADSRFSYDQQLIILPIILQKIRPRDEPRSGTELPWEGLRGWGTQKLRIHLLYCIGCDRDIENLCGRCVTCADAVALKRRQLISNMNLSQRPTMQRQTSKSRQFPGFSFDKSKSTKSSSSFVSDNATLQPSRETKQPRSPLHFQNKWRPFDLQVKSKDEARRPPATIVSSSSSWFFFADSPSKC